MIDPDDDFDADDEYEEEEDDDAQNEQEEDFTYEANQRLYDEIAARTRTNFAPGVYKHAINKRFPIAKRGFLPIVAEDYTYTMDIMFMSVVLRENTAMNKIYKRQTRGIPIVEGHGQVGQTPPVIGGLVLVETTSRKIFFYKLHSKDPREVLYVFKWFLTDVDGKIARLLSDRGNEYEGIRLYNQNKKLFRYWQANASQNNHTALSRVDRAIKTIRSLVNNYYAEYENADWVDAIDILIDTYNNTVHGSLYLKDEQGHKYSYTPNQVWSDPELRRRIKIKDYLEKYKNYRYYDRNFKPGDLVYYRLLPKQMKNKNHKGFLSIFPGKIICRVGNSYKIQLKGTFDRELDEEEGNMDHFNGPKLKVPARDLVPAKKVHANPSKYNIHKALGDDREKLLGFIPGGHDLQWLDDHRLRPAPRDWFDENDSDDYVPPKPKKKRGKHMQIFVDDEDDEVQQEPDFFIPQDVEEQENKEEEDDDDDDDDIDFHISPPPSPPPPPPPAPKIRKQTKNGITTYVAPPPVPGMIQLPYEQFAQAARTLDYSDVNDLLRTQQAFVDGSVARAPPPPPINVSIKAAQPAAKPKPKTKKQPKKRRTEVEDLNDVNHRVKPSSLKRIPKPNQKYQDYFK